MGPKTPLEAIVVLNNFKIDVSKKGAFDMFEAIGIATEALREVEQYRKIGTVEECRAAMRKLQEGT